jgi:hypothetical protein
MLIAVLHAQQSVADGEYLWVGIDEQHPKRHLSLTLATQPALVINSARLQVILPQQQLKLIRLMFSPGNATWRNC